MYRSDSCNVFGGERPGLQAISVIQKESAGERLVINKTYDNGGYLIRRVDYTQANELDSMVMIVKREASNNRGVRNGVRSIMVDENNIYLYNSIANQIITIPRPR